MLPAAGTEPFSPPVPATHCVSCGGRLVTRYPRVSDAQTREVFAVGVCTSCGLGHTIPQPASLDRYYADYHGGRHGVTQAWCLRRRLSFVRQVARHVERRALDIGCGDGSFLLALKRSGWVVQGSEYAPESARAAGLDVVADLTQIPEGQRFGLVTLWHSLEHMRDPRQVIGRVHELLAPGGVVLIAVPDAGSPQARVFGPAWVHLDVPRHLFHFTEDALVALLRGSGLDVVRAWRHELELDLFGWTQSSLNLVLPEPNVLFARLTGHATRASAAVVGASFLFGAVLTAAAVPIVAAGVVGGHAGTLVVAASSPGDGRRVDRSGTAPPRRTWRDARTAPASPVDGAARP